MVATLVLEASAERRESSSLSSRTKFSLTDGVQCDKLSVHIKVHSRLRIPSNWTQGLSEVAGMLTES